MSLSRIVATLALLSACSGRAQAQLPTGSMLRIEIENSTLYIFDCPNAQLAKNPNKLDRPLGPAFESAQGIGDIVSVNGSTVKGAAYQSILSALVASPNPSPGGAIADSTRQAVIQWELDFLNPDRTQIGTVRIGGMNGGLGPPGAPKDLGGGTGYTVIGGTGAFFGVRGYFQPTNDPVLGERLTSACEDPSMRRVNAGGRGRRHAVLYLVPLEQPQIITTADGPAVVHATDFSPVSAAKPAKAGEILALIASGLGPTRPGVDPGLAFTADPQQVVSSPVQVLVNGNPGEVFYAGGYPGAVDRYQVNFRVPDGTAAGQASIQLTSAWIAGPAVKIPVQ